MFEGVSMRIREAMRNRSLSVVGLALAADVSKTSVQRWRTSDELALRMSLAAVKRLCDEMRVDPDWLLTGRGTMDD